MLYQLAAAPGHGAPGEPSQPAMHSPVADLMKIWDVRISLGTDVISYSDNIQVCRMKQARASCNTKLVIPVSCAREGIHLEHDQSPL